MNKHTKNNSQRKQKPKMSTFAINDSTLNCILPDTVNPNLPSGSHSTCPLVLDIHADPSTKKPPDPHQKPFQRITRSMTK